ncbi:MAG: glycosyltransferase family 9 protein [Chitinispirillaceae bacterium]|jgi:ADP-heptose:LPS heptosyltransferase
MLYVRKKQSLVTMEGRKECLVLRLDGIGDTIVFSGCLKLIREKYPIDKITIVVRSYVKELLEKCPYVDEIIPWDFKKFAYNPLYRGSFLRGILKRNISSLLYPMWSQTEAGEDICKVSNAENIYAFDSNPQGNPDWGKWNLVKVPVENRSELDRYVFFMKTLGISIGRAEIFPTMWISSKDKEKVEGILSQYGLSSFLVLFPCAGSRNRIWPVEKWLALINELIKLTGKDIVLLGGKGDKVICNWLTQSVGNSRIKNLCGFMGLRELGEFIKRSSLYIGSETGALQMAVAVKTPAVSIMGGGHYGRFFPYGDLSKNRIVTKEMDCYNCDWNCKYDSEKCVSEISVNNVLDALVGLLWKKGGLDG